MTRPYDTAPPAALIGLYCLVAGGAAKALIASHSPFFPDENYVIALDACEPAGREIRETYPPDGSAIFAAPDGRRLVFTMSTGTSDAGEREIYLERYAVQVEHDGGPLTPEVELPFAATVAHLLPETAACADLNRDGIVDFVTDHSRHGNGLGAAFYDRLVILSAGPGSYRFWQLETMWPSPEDYVTFGKIEPIVMLTTSFAQSQGAVRHSYLVYDLWKFTQSEVVPANHIDNRFPKWVWMTLVENHKPASSLSEDDKKRMREPRVAMELTPR